MHFWVAIKIHNQEKLQNKFPSRLLLKTLPNSDWVALTKYTESEKGKRLACSSFPAAVSNLSSWLAEMPRSPLLSFLLLSSIFSCTGRGKVRPCPARRHKANRFLKFKSLWFVMSSSLKSNLRYWHGLSIHLMPISWLKELVGPIGRSLLGIL